MDDRAKKSSSGKSRKIWWVNFSEYGRALSVVGKQLNIKSVLLYARFSIFFTPHHFRFSNWIDPVAINVFSTQKLHLSIIHRYLHKFNLENCIIQCKEVTYISHHRPEQRLYQVMLIVHGLKAINIVLKNCLVLLPQSNFYITIISNSYKRWAEYLGRLVKYAQRLML